MNYYQNKESKYYSGTRSDIISFLKNGAQKSVLEIGAGGGDSLCYIKENGLAQEVVGVELFELKDSNQNNSKIDKFIISNIENQDLELEESYFDIIILADILEHLVDPWKAVEYISKFLKVGGRIIASLPNVRDYKTMIKIYGRGDFRYREDGILDKTHLRFFCKKNMISLLTTSNLTVKSSISAFQLRQDRKARKLIDKITFGAFQQFLTIQYIFEVEKSNE